MDYLQNPVLLSLLPYFAVELPSALRVALLGLAAGFSPGELGVLPGLAQAKRLREALRELEDSGRIVRAGAGYTCVAAPPPCDNDVRDLLKRHSKLRRTLDMLAEPMTRLRARGLGTIGAGLEDSECSVLLSALVDAEASASADRQLRKRARCSLLHFVARRVPRDASRVTPLGPRPLRAPDGLLERSRRLMPAYADKLARLYTALVPYDEVVMDHWWRILQAHVDLGLSGEALWNAWRPRLESYILRRRIPLSTGVRLLGVEARKLKASYPVPDEGYGVWVDDELRLWRRFCGRFEPAMGYYLARALWAEAHETVPGMLRQQHDGARPSLVSEEHYQDCLFRAAEACSGLSAKVLADLRRGFRRTAAVRAARANAEREVTALAIRAAVAKAARLAADGRAMVTDRDVKGREWAVAVLRAVAMRRTEMALSSDEFMALLKLGDGFGPQGGLRVRRRMLSEQVRRDLDSTFQLAPVIIGPREKVPLRRVWARVRDLAHGIMSADVSDEERKSALQGLCDYVEHRDCIDIVYDDGTVERRRISDAVALVGNDVMAHSLVSSMLRRVRRTAHRPEVSRAA